MRRTGGARQCAPVRDSVRDVKAATSWSLIFVAAAGCASPPPPAAPATAPAATETSAAEPAPTAEPEPTTPYAKIIEIEPAGKRDADAHVKMLFINPTSGDCRFHAYGVVWPGGKKSIDGKNFKVPAGGRRQRSLRVHADDGDLSTLSDAHTEVESDCGAE
jgi:hypothetical protein